MRPFVWRAISLNPLGETRAIFLMHIHVCACIHLYVYICLCAQSVYNLLGETLSRLQQYNEAEKWFQASLASQPDHVPAHITYGKLLARNVSLSFALLSIHVCAFVRTLVYADECCGWGGRGLHSSVDGLYYLMYREYTRGANSPKERD